MCIAERGVRAWRVSSGNSRQSRQSRQSLQSRQSRQSLQSNNSLTFPRLGPYRVHSMAWTQADIDALQRAIADGRGVRSIAFVDGQSVTFNSPAEMLELLAIMQQTVNSSTRQGYRVAATSKGV